MRRTFGIVISVVAITLCTAMAAGGTTSSAKLSKELLMVHNMAPGWQAGNDAGANGVGCLKNLLEPASVKQTGAAQAYFVYRGFVPVFDEKLATYASAKKAYTTIVKTINACHVISGYSTSGHHVTGTVSPMKFAHTAIASSAYAMKLTDVGVTLRYDYVIARKNSVVIAILEANTSPVSTSQFTGLVKQAVSKVH